MIPLSVLDGNTDFQWWIRGLNHFRIVLKEAFRQTAVHMKQIHHYFWASPEEPVWPAKIPSAVFPEIPALEHFMWHTDKTDTRLFCGFLRKTWLRIAIATGEKTMKFPKDTMYQKRTSETMQFHHSLLQDTVLAHSNFPFDTSTQLSLASVGVVWTYWWEYAPPYFAGN